MTRHRTDVDRTDLELRWVAFRWCATLGAIAAAVFGPHTNLLGDALLGAAASGLGAWLLPPHWWAR